MFIEGTGIGAVTDVAGKYTLQIPENTSGESILIFSFIGFVTKEFR